MARPFITLKLATSLDGKIALANGMSEWITCEKSREQGRRLRGDVDAIAIGANTAVVDNPQLTTRFKDLSDPMRIIFDSQIRLSIHSNIAQTARDIPALIFCASNCAMSDRAKQLETLGVNVIPVTYYEDTTSRRAGLDIAEALSKLHRLNIRSLLVEGGGILAASFLKGDFIDEIHWYRAPIILGGDARDGIGVLGLERLDLAKRFERIDIKALDDDLFERYMRRTCSQA